MLNTGKINALSQESRIRLRRAFGKSVHEIDMHNAIAFYSVAPQELTAKEEEDLFFVVTMYCHYQEHAKQGVRFSEAVSTYYKQCSDAGKKEILALMDAPYDMNGTFLPRLYSVIRKMESKDIYIDPEDMYQGLRYWDSKSKQRKTQIAKQIVAVKEDSEE